jgi:hypothetical protein
MRTRIDIAGDQRERLLRLAAEKGEKGCARLVQEAVAQYLDQQERPPMVVQFEAQPVLRAETRAERARLVIQWVLEEAVGLMTVARTYRGRLRRSTVAAS